jgi:HEAT repeat protein
MFDTDLDISDIVGDEGEDLARFILRGIALVNPREKDVGLDFHCELRENRAFAFWVQAKGSERLNYTSDTVTSLPVDRHTIEDYWLAKAHPVFILLSDTRKVRTFFLPVTNETYQPRDSTSGTHRFSIPLKNEITRANIGDFVAEVVRLQPPITLTAEDALAWIDDYQREHPLLHQDPDQIDTLLEIMRGDDQSAQVEAKFAIKQLFEAGKLKSERLVDGLVSIFRASKDRITQTHVLETLVFLRAKRIVPDVIRQIDRTQSLQAYRRTHPQHRHSFTSFLFSALVRLEARGILPNIRKYFGHPESHIVQQAVSTCGVLRLKGGARDLLRLLSHPDGNVRIVTAQALSKYHHKYITQECIQILRNADSAEAVHGAIYTLAYLRDSEHTEEVAKFSDHRQPKVRQAVAHYLGFIDAVDYAGMLVELMMDMDSQVRSQASISFIERLSLEDTVKERMVLPELEAAFDEGREIDVDSLLGVVQRCGSEQSRPLLLRIYEEDDGVLMNHRVLDGNGEARGVKPIDLKTRVLEILKRFGVPELHRDIVHQITHADEDVVQKYIRVAQDLGLTEAFSAITSLDDETVLNMMGIIVTALIELDSDRAAEWALSRMDDEPSLAECLVCCSIISLLDLEDRDTENIAGQLVRLFQDPDNRLVPGIYGPLRQYEVTAVTPIIIEDLNAGGLHELEERQAVQLLHQMLKTLATVGGRHGRDYLISLLPQVAPGFRSQILHLLAEIGDDPSIEAVEGCLNDPDSSVRAVAYRLSS